MPLILCLKLSLLTLLLALVLQAILYFLQWLLQISIIKDQKSNRENKKRKWGHTYFCTYRLISLPAVKVSFHCCYWTYYLRDWSTAKHEVFLIEGNLSEFQDWVHTSIHTLSCSLFMSLLFLINSLLIRTWRSDWPRSCHQSTLRPSQTAASIYPQGVINHIIHQCINLLRCQFDWQNVNDADLYLNISCT